VPISKKVAPLVTFLDPEARRLPYEVYSSLTEGIIQHATIQQSAFAARETRTLQAIQYVQAHPDEVAPAGWQPSTIKQWFPISDEVESLLCIIRFW